MDCEVREKTVRKVPGTSSARKTVSLGSIDSSFAANPLAVRRSLNQGTAKNVRKGAHTARSSVRKPLPLEKSLPPKLLYKLQTDLAALMGSSTSSDHGASNGGFSGGIGDIDGLTMSPRSGRPLPAGWTAHLSGGQVYYNHAPSKHTQWVSPGPDDDFSGVRSGHVKLSHEAYAPPGRWALEGGSGPSVLSDNESDDGGSTDGSTSTSSSAGVGDGNRSAHVGNDLGDGVSDGSSVSASTVRPRSSGGGAAPVLGAGASDNGCSNLYSNTGGSSRPNSRSTGRPVSHGRERYRSKADDFGSLRGRPTLTKLPGWCSGCGGSDSCDGGKRRP
jgi:hypothetical protein